MPSYGKHVFNRRIAIAQQTVAEVRYRAIAAGWGEQRLETVERLLNRSRVLPGAHPEAEDALAAVRAALTRSRAKVLALTVHPR